MTREEALQQVIYLLDNSGSATHYKEFNAMIKPAEADTLIGWQQDVPVFVAVHGIYGKLSESEAIETASDYLEEIAFFGPEVPYPDYIVN